MHESVTVADLVNSLAPRIGLEYVFGMQSAANRILHDATEGGPSIAGHLNLIRPNRIQLIGKTEANYIHGLNAEEKINLIRQLATTRTLAVIFAEGTAPFIDLPVLKEHPLPIILSTRAGSHEVIALVRYFLQQKLAISEIRHGVFMEIFGYGVLITGNSSIGKSEVALELISRGHRLIADDAPEFTRIAPDILLGTCPALLRDMLEVRGLGVLNIRAMYGDSAIKRGKYLRLVIKLCTPDNHFGFEEKRLEEVREETEILGMRIPLVELAVAPGRNIAVLIEAAVRAHLLHMQGYLASEDLRSRQKDLMEQGEIK